ncbi:MAG: hypothetical protein HUU34_08080 [Saprospiraceae bacterium]|jgi:hypothetical protein|nr:hypothetical protein [Saprospiraceae bacterium]
MIRSTKGLLVALLLAVPMLASAHAGHGSFSWDDIRHYVFSPEHAVPVVAIVLLGVTLMKAALYLNRADKKADHSDK